MVRSNDPDSFSEVVLERMRLAEASGLAKEVGARWAAKVGPLAALEAQVGEQEYLNFLIAYAKQNLISLSSPDWVARIEGHIARAAFYSEAKFKLRGGHLKESFGIGFAAPAPPLFSKVNDFKMKRLLAGEKVTDDDAIRAISLADFRVKDTDELSRADYADYESLVESRRKNLARQRKAMRASVGKKGKQKNPV